MATHSTAAKATDASFLDRHHFLLRRLHSLTGIVPVGMFVIFHLFTNAQMVFPGKFQHEVEFIHSLPALLFLEIFGLWVPIGFHAALGLVYTFTGRINTDRYKHTDNWRYTLQRITGIVALIFIFLHIATLRWRWDIGGWFTPFYVFGPDGQPLAHATTAMALQASWLVIVLYFVGALSVVYHWSNGLWTAAITWGATITVGAQRRWGYLCLGLGLALSIFTLASIWGAVTYQPSEQEINAVQTLKSGQVQPHDHQGLSAPESANH